MLRFMTNMRVLAKIAVPAFVIAAACLGIVIYAANSLHGLAGTADGVIRGEAKRVELALEAEALFNSAAVTEKNIILYTKEDDVRAGIEQYGKITGAVLRTLDQLATVTDATEQKTLIEAFRAAVMRRRDISSKVFEFSLKRQNADAFALSATEGARQRKAAIESADGLIALNRGRLEEARLGAHALAQQGRAILIATSVVGLCVAFALLGWIAAFQIGHPIGAMTRQMEKLANGDLEIEVSGTDRRDEVGALARSLLVFKQNAIIARQLETDQRADHKQKEERQRTVAQLIARFDEQARGAIGMLAAAATELSATSKSMSNIADETSRQATSVAAGSAEASANVQTVAAATEELAASIQEISRQVAASAGIASEAVADADRTNTKMLMLTEAADKIGQVISLIQNIANQTNLLALNATIEAARAGEHGKGFAVVASEVKALAGQTAKATGEISAQISAIQAATSDAVDSIRGIGTTIGKIDEIAAMIAAGVEQQGAATQEIARNVQEAAGGTQSITANITGVNQAAAETGSAALEVLAAADELGKQGERLRSDINEFLNRIRAA